MHVVAWLPNWIGDVVMATPALRALRERFPEAHITGVGRPLMADVLAGTTLLDTFLADPRTAAGSRELLRALRALPQSTAVLFPNSFRSAWLAYRGGCTQRVGTGGNLRRPLLTHPLPAHDRSHPYPTLKLYLEVVAAAGCSAHWRPLELATTTTDDEQFAALLQRHPQLVAGEYICLNSGGAFGAAKHWPAGSFAQLARQLWNTHRRPLVVLCGPAEREIARTIARAAGEIPLCTLADEQVSVGLSKAVVRHARLLITTDSGPRHFGTAFGIPTITLFGPTHVAWSETFSPRTMHLQRQVPCGPCQRRVCPLGHHRCMTELTVGEVAAAAGRMLGTAAMTVGGARHVAGSQTADGESGGHKTEPGVPVTVDVPRAA